MTHKKIDTQHQENEMWLTHEQKNQAWSEHSYQPLKTNSYTKDNLHRKKSPKKHESPKNNKVLAPVHLRLRKKRRWT